MNASLQDCFTPYQLNSLRLKNRFVKAGTYEGMTPNGRISQAYRDFHLSLAKGGLAMTTLGYCAVEQDGRINENMLYMHEGIRADLSSLIDELHAAGTKVSGQMGHCGAFTKNRQLQRRFPLGPSRGINLLGFAYGMFYNGKMQQSDIDALVQNYYDAAVFMQSVGFDCLEIHFGHGYGLCQFMSPLTNKRKDAYGGTLENRMRLPLQVLAAVRKAVGPDFPIIGKISLTEGVKGGLHYDDAVAIAKMLDAAGIDGIITSGGTSTMNPMIMFRGQSALPPMIKAEKHWLMKFILKTAGAMMFKHYPYHELYFAEQAKRVQQAVSCDVIYIGGASTNQSFADTLSNGFPLMQLGRSLLADRDLVKKAQADSNYKSRCLHCNECIATIEHAKGIHCTRFAV
ncbi:MAG: NADH:flavin oxidoreductase [Pseudomonadales bacterium]|nr:NADH:flavin oxidoreductase [Pseudomonadales bacterium]